MLLLSELVLYYGDCLHKYYITKTRNMVAKVGSARGRQGDFECTILLHKTKNTPYADVLLNLNRLWNPYPTRRGLKLEKLICGAIEK